MLCPVRPRRKVHAYLEKAIAVVMHVTGIGVTCVAIRMVDNDYITYLHEAIVDPKGLPCVPVNLGVMSSNPPTDFIQRHCCLFTGKLLNLPTRAFRVPYGLARDSLKACWHC